MYLEIVLKSPWTKIDIETFPWFVVLKVNDSVISNLVTISYRCSKSAGIWKIIQLKFDTSVSSTKGNISSEDSDINFQWISVAWS